MIAIRNIIDYSVLGIMVRTFCLILRSMLRKRFLNVFHFISEVKSAQIIYPMFGAL